MGRLGGVRQCTARRTRHRRMDRSLQPQRAGHRAGAAGQDRRACAAGRASRRRGRPRRDEPRHRARERPPDHRRPEPSARRHHPAVSDLHPPRHGRLRVPFQRRSRPVRRGAGRHAQGTRPGGAGVGCARRRALHHARLARGRTAATPRGDDDDVRDRDTALARAEAQDLILSAEQAEALAHVTDGCSLGIIIGHAGTGKSAMLDAACKTWEAAGLPHRHSLFSPWKKGLGGRRIYCAGPTGNDCPVHFFRATKNGQTALRRALAPRCAGRWPLQSSTDLHHYQRLR